MQSRLDDARVVHHHQRSFGQILGQVVEHILPYLTPAVKQQLRVVALGHRELRDALVGQVVGVIADMYFFCIHRLQ